MKGRIGKYKDKIVVWGDPNLTAKNEINIDSLGGGGQADIPIEYYKVVAPEGVGLNEAREGMFSIIADEVSSAFPNLYISVKGTSSSSMFSSFTGFSIISILGLENKSIHAYEIKPLNTTAKCIANGTLEEPPNFNNIFDALDYVEPSISLQLKQALVPITAEEFYNLDDLK